MFNRQPVAFADYVLSDASAEPTPAEREAWEKRLSYARELAHPSVAQQIETSKLQVAEQINASRPQADQLPAGKKVMLRRSARVRGKNISPFEPFPEKRQKKKSQKKFFCSHFLKNHLSQFGV